MANPFGKMPGLGNIGELMKQAQKMQEDATRVESELAEARVDAQAGGGLVKVSATGKGEILEIKIAKEVIDPDDIETLEDLVTVAVRDAIDQANAMREERLKAMMPPGMSGGLPGGLFG